MKKKFLFLVVTLLLLVCTVVLFACGDNNNNNNDNIDKRPNLTLTSNIEGVANLTGGGHYDYNEDVSILVDYSDEYAFLGWYYGKDLLSKSPSYNLKMWDRDTTLTATFTKRIKDESGEYVSSDSDGKYNLVVKSNIYSLGSVSLNDSSSVEEHKTKQSVSESIKVVAFTKSDKQFLGWYDGDNNLIMTNASFEFSMPATDFTLIAKWKCDHKWRENYIVKQPTCSTKGLKYDRICTVCNEVEGETILDINPIAHSFENNICKYCGVSNDAGDFTYRKISDGKYEITGISSENKSSELTIPSKFYLGDIVSIAESAFENNTRIKSITIPNSVTSIGRKAFLGCSSLTSIYYTGDVAGWCGISGRGNLMSTSRTLYIGGNKVEGELIIPDGVTSIGDAAFSGRTGLTSINIPDSVTSIGDAAFSGCTGLTSINIPDSVTSIGDSAFSGCTGLTSINIPDSVTIITADAFYECSGLVNVIIGNSVTSIGDAAFYGCSGLTSVTIGNSLASIEWNAFQGCSELTSIYYTGDVAGWCGISGLDELMYYFSSSRTLYIGGNKVEKLIIPDSVKSIPSSAFRYCGGLTSVTIGSSVTSIGDYAFYGCDKLIEVHNKSSLTITAGESNNGYVAYYAKNIYTEEGGSKLSTDENGYVIYTDGTEKILVAYTGTETKLTFPSDITQIYECAFYGRSGLTSVTIPDSVTSIGDWAFRYCERLTAIIFNGTKSQWNAISKGSSWNYRISRYCRVYCTDGDIKA